MEKKKIVIITDNQLYKKKSAAYERIACYALSLPHLEFYIYELDQNYSNQSNIRINGSGNIIFIFGKKKKKNYFFRNVINSLDFITPFKLVKLIKKTYSSQNASILLYTSNFFLSFYSVIILKIFAKFKIIAEKNELQIAIVINMKLPHWKSAIPFLILFPLKLLIAFASDITIFFVSKIIVISSNLERLYTMHPFVYKIPILVHVDRFPLKNNNKKIELPIKFVYLGTITKKKDAIFDIIKAIVKIKDKLYKKAHFSFIGEGNKKNLIELKYLIKKNDLQDIILIKDPIESNRVAIELLNYDFALLVRSKNLQTFYGFSTKLGEYLAAGLPVIFTDVSDNLKFLKDNVHGFLVPFPLRNNLANVLEKAILTDYNQLFTMKENVRLLAKTKLDFNNFSKDLKSIFS